MSHPARTQARLGKGVVFALLAAALFGASTPLSKILLEQVAAVTLAGMLYLGSGIGLLAIFIARAIFHRNDQYTSVPLSKQDAPWFVASIAVGGIAGPVLLMIGLGLTQASTASLLLNMEGVFTALLAWFVFRENFDRRIFLGMGLIVFAGVLLSSDQVPAFGIPWGTVAIIGACLCWAIDNNLTRKVSASDPLQIAGIKGLVAGSVNIVIPLGMGLSLPGMGTMVGAGLVGFCGYGLSLMFFVLALRHLGTARTAAYFSAAPFVGALLSLFILGESPPPLFWIAAVLMGAGLWLHLTESHIHEHRHDPVDHLHMHSHDEHHQHAHADGEGAAPHAHPHHHAALVHSHSHYPDTHHRHDH
jgi:drug/metabolite transporter (DMT)-like permease